jgi:hypothetical protein
MRTSATSQALSNLRGYVILIVLGFHAILAYLGSLPATVRPFDRPPYEWLSFPIIDKQRWFGFDLFCAWHDVYLMSLMFFLSGLFVWPSLARKGSGRFLADRLLRLGLPLVLVVYLLMPVALYPAYRIRTPDPNLADYWRQWMALPAWPCGPQWFLWQLLALNIVVAALHRYVARADDLVRRAADWANAYPCRFLIALLAASAMTYIPSALIFTPWRWYEFGPFAFQFCRPLHYSVYFLAGIVVGVRGLERSLLATEGILAKRWTIAAAFAAIGFLAWIIPTALIESYYGRPGPIALQLAAGLGFVLCCAGGCLFVMALVLRFAHGASRLLGSLSDNAYGMYLIHYVFVVWLQYALLDTSLPAVVKGAAVFVGVVLLSWGVTLALGAVPLGSRVIGARQRPPPSHAKSALPPWGRTKS